MPGVNDIKTCAETGVCGLHHVEIERRKVDREGLKTLISELKDHQQLCEAKVGNIHDRISSVETTAREKRLEGEKAIHDRITVNGTKISAVFLSFWLIGAIVFGSYYYTNTVDIRNDRGEEILLKKINADARDAKEERAALVVQVVSLLNATAENKEWQRGVLRQLEMLNFNVSKNNSELNQSKIQKPIYGGSPK